jgi:hypothetical protein
MNRHSIHYLVAATCLVMPGASVVASDARELEHNPFSRPPSERTVPERGPIAFSDGTQPTLDLRATMVGTRDRLANVGGRILRPGDDIQGYTLLRVYEDRAVFSKQNNIETIYVKPDPVESDEQ